MNNTIVIVGLVASFMVLAQAFVLWDRRKRARTLPRKRRLIAALDLTDIRLKAAKRHGWTADTAIFLEGEYRDFLLLMAENPSSTISPWTDALDLFWHEHILNTTRYAAERAHTPGMTSSETSHLSAVGSETPILATVVRECRPPSMRSRSTSSTVTGACPGGDGRRFTCPSPPAHR